MKGSHEPTKERFFSTEGPSQNTASELADLVDPDETSTVRALEAEFYESGAAIGVTTD